MGMQVNGDTKWLKLNSQGVTPTSVFLESRLSPVSIGTSKWKSLLTGSYLQVSLLKNEMQEQIQANLSAKYFCTSFQTEAYYVILCRRLYFLMKFYIDGILLFHLRVQNRGIMFTALVEMDQEPE